MSKVYTVRRHYIPVCQTICKLWFWLFFINILLFFFILFLSKGNVLKITAKFCVSFFLFHNIGACVLVCLYSLLLILSGHVEINPRPLSNCKEFFSISHWNLSSISTHDYSKIFLLKAYIIFHKFDIICLSETYLDSTTPNDDDKLQIPRYTLIRSEHPSNTKLGRVCIYYKSSLPLQARSREFLRAGEVSEN